MSAILDALAKTDGLFVVVSELYLTPSITDAVAPGQLFALQYHWSGTGNALTTSYTDPKTTIPWYKGARVGLRRVGPSPADARPSPLQGVDRLG